VGAVESGNISSSSGYTTSKAVQSQQTSALLQQQAVIYMC
jgi:hypothetical protein